MILVIAKHELRSAFLAIKTWIILAIVQFLSAWLFFTHMERYTTLQPKLANMKNIPGVTDWVIAPFYNDLATILLLITPLLSMRLFSNERQAQTMTLLRSAPLSTRQLVLGKYLGLFNFLLIIIILTSMMPLSLTLGTTIDAGKMMSCILGTILLAGAFTATGLYFSALTKNPITAAMSTFGLFLVLFVFDFTSDKATDNIFVWLSTPHHLQAFLQGVFSTDDIVYFSLFIITFLALTHYRLHSDNVSN